MARPGTNTTLYSPASVTSGVATALHAAWAAGGAALGNWTVNPLKTFGAGTSERNYFVLSAGTVEVLISFNNGTAVFHSSSVYAPFQDTNYNTLQSMYWSFAREGGFEAAFVAGFDPVNQNFWDHISVTLSRTPAAAMLGFRDAASGSTNPKYYLLCDDTANMLMIMVGDRDGWDHYNIMICADDMFENGGIHTTEQLHPEGFCWTYIPTGAGVPDGLFYTGAWKTSDDSFRGISSANNMEHQNPYSGATSAAITLGGTLMSNQVLVYDADKIWGKYNANYIRTTPLDDPLAYKTVWGTDVNYQWVKLYDYLMHPWEVGYAAPT